MMKKYILLFIIGLSINCNAQNSNVFLNRNFWKTNPDIKTIDKKISEGNDISASSKNAFDGVTYAILGGVDNKTIKYLLSKQGNGVNKLTHDGRTYIFWAANKNNLEIMKYLVSKGAKTDITDSHGYSLLNFAATTGQKNKDIYDFIFSKNADIKNEKNHNGANALLLIAPHLNDFSLAEYLISKGASINDKDNEGNGLFEYAAKGGNIEFLKTLLKVGVNKGENTMIFASQGLRRKKNSLKTYKFLESVGVNPNSIDKKGRNPLHSISYNNKDKKIYEYFINKGVNVNQQDNSGNTPFMNAASRNKLEIVTYLSNYTNDINLKDKKGSTALNKAVSRNNVEVIAYLLNKGADINTIDNEGNSIAFYLIDSYRERNSKDFDKKLQLLISNGIELNKNQHNNNSLIHVATKNNSISLLKKLEPFNIDVNIKNSNNLTALQIAAMKGKDDEIIKYLLKIGANKDVTTEFGESIYDLALENELLQKQNVNISFLK